MESLAKEPKQHRSRRVKRAPFHTLVRCSCSFAVHKERVNLTRRVTIKLTHHVGR